MKDATPRLLRDGIRMHDIVTGSFAAAGANAHAFGDDCERAYHATTIAPGDVPEWIQLVPMGTIETRDGRGPFVLKDAAAAQAAIENSRAYHGAGNPIPMDFDHQLEHTEKNGAGAPASGWITDLAVRDDGIYGRVEWTEDGAEALRKRKYRYLSPVIAYSARTHDVLGLLRAGLTNKPNLPALAAINSTTTSGDAMSDSLKAALQRLAAILGLPTTADEGAIEAAANSIVDSEKIHREALAALRTKLKLGNEANADQILVAAQATATADPAKFVPIETHQAVTAKLEELQRDNAMVAVNAAIESGKIAPANKDWAIAYCARDPKGFADFVGRTTPIVRPGEEQRREVETRQTTLTAAEKAICANTGVSEEEFLKTRNANARKEG